MKACIVSILLTVFLSVQCFAMGLSFGPTTPEPAPEIKEIQYGKFINPKSISSWNKDWMLTVDSGKVSNVYAVNKHNTEYDKFLMQINGRVTAIHKTWYGYWVANKDGASSPEGGAVELYSNAGKLRKKLFKVVQHVSDIATNGNLIYVVDSGDNKVKIFEYWGFQLGTLSHHYMEKPCNIAVYGKPWKSTIVVSANGGTRIDKFGNKYEVQPAVLIFSSYRGKTKLRNVFFGKNYNFSRPRGVAIKNGILYVADTLQGKLVGIDLRTNLPVNAIGEFGGDRGQLMQPKDMIYDRNLDTFYVVDRKKGSIEAIKEY